MLSRSRSAAIKSAFLRAKAASPDGWLSLDELRKAIAAKVPDASDDEITDRLLSLARRFRRQADEFKRAIEQRRALR